MILEWAAMMFPREPWFAASGHSPMYVWQRRRGERGHWPTSVYRGEALVRFTALTFPA